MASYGALPVAPSSEEERPAGDGSRMRRLRRLVIGAASFVTGVALVATALSLDYPRDVAVGSALNGLPVTHTTTKALHNMSCTTDRDCPQGLPVASHKKDAGHSTSDADVYRCVNSECKMISTGQLPLSSLSRDAVVATPAPGPHPPVDGPTFPSPTVTNQTKSPTVDDNGNFPPTDDGLVDDGVLSRDAVVATPAPGPHPPVNGPTFPSPTVTNQTKSPTVDDNGNFPPTDDALVNDDGGGRRQ